MGLFEPAGGVAAQILDEDGITRATVEEQIVVVVPRSPATVAGADPPYTPRAGKSIERAVAEALGLGHNYVGTEHLLLSLFGEPAALAATILGASGATYDQVRARVIEKLSGYASPQPWSVVTAPTRTGPGR